MKCVILQPSYIPWRGYFHQIYLADVFVFYDDVQYDKHGWRNRNRIKTHQGLQWLTIPVQSKGVVDAGLPIGEVRIDWRQPWNRKHWQSIQQAYSKAPYFADLAELLQAAYQRQDDCLADLTIDLTIELARRLGFDQTRFLRSSNLAASGAKTDRLISILQQVGATQYVSGPSARSYLEPEKFERAGIELFFMEYKYPDYLQLYPPFEKEVSILDLMFMTGPQAIQYIITARQSWEP